MSSVSQQPGKSAKVSFFKPGLRIKVTSLILTLITAVIVSIGVYLINTQRKQLINAITIAGEKETKALRFLAARSILSQDDLGIIDTLQNISSLNGFVYGMVRSSTGRLIANRGAVPQNLNLENNDKYGENKSILQDSETIDGARYFIFKSSIAHPFVAVNPPVLGNVTLVFSDEYANSLFRENIKDLAFAGLIFWIIGIAGSLFLSMLIVKPVRILSKGATAIGSGNLSYRLPDLGADELGLLAKQFNVMAASLEEAREQRETRLILDEQIKQATEIQEGMNPSRFIDKPDLQIKGFTRAAKGVGGDYFDYLFLPDGRIALSITDVSGKSISASLVMVLIKTVIVTYTKLFDKVRGDRILSIINQVISAQTHIDKFATIMFCVYDPRSRVLEFSNGGHGPLLLYRANGEQMTLSKIEGLPLGIEDTNIYSIGKTIMNPGDILVLYTDGITEAWDKERNEFGLTRLREKILQYRRFNAKEIVNKLIEDIDNFSKDCEQHDDMTLLIMKIPPQ